MRHLARLACALSLLLLIVRLFTYEFSLADDPTSGLALRPWPGLSNRRVLHSSAELRGSWILAQDENELLGSGLYRFTVSVGWLGAPLLAAALLLLAHRRAPQSPR